MKKQIFIALLLAVAITMVPSCNSDQITKFNHLDSIANSYLDKVKTVDTIVHKVIGSGQSDSAIHEQVKVLVDSSSNFADSAQLYKDSAADAVK